MPTLRSQSRENTPLAHDGPLPRTATTRARSTRSQSRDPSDPSEPPQARRNNRRKDRQASVESVGSVSSRTSQTKRKTRANGGSAPTVVLDLTTIPEYSSANTPVSSAAMAHKDVGRGPLATPYRTVDRIIETSPGVASNISGTTAISAFSSFSAAEAADLDAEMMSMFLPSLYQCSGDLLRLIAPVSSTADELRTITREIKIPASKTGKALAGREKSYSTPRGYFGTSEYIQRDTVLRSLLGIRSAEELGSEPWRLDEILYNANLASFAYSIIGSERDSEKTRQAVDYLDGLFPLHFLDTFHPSGQASTAVTVGSSALEEETFQLGLELRTQKAIMALAKDQNEETFDPDESITPIFFTPSTERDSLISEMEDLLQNGQLKGWDVPRLGGGQSPMAKKYQTAIKTRISEIQRYFLDNEGASDEGWVDLDELGAKFSWSDFVVQVLDWVRKRSQEIDGQIERRGGIDKLMEVLNAEIAFRSNPTSYQRDAVEPNVDLAEPDMPEPEAPHSNQAAAVSLKNEATYARAQVADRSFASREGIALLKRREKRLSEQGVQPQPDTAQHANEEKQQIQNQQDKPTSKQVDPTRTDTAKVTVEEDEAVSGNIPLEDDWRPVAEDDTYDDDDRDNDDNVEAHGKAPTSSAPLSTQERLQQYRSAQKQDKENTARSRVDNQLQQRRSFIDRQPNAKRLRFDEGSQAEEDGQHTQPLPASSSKRKRQPAVADDETDDDEFEQEQRRHDVAKRRKPPAAAAAAPREPVPVRAPPHDAPRAALEDEDANSSDGGPEAVRLESRGTQYNAINRAAKMIAAMRKKEARVRHAWTEEEVRELIQLIAELGCSWARIKKYDELGRNVLHRRTQVDIRDKARNMKCDYLSAGVGMPRNFELVYLTRRQEERLANLGIEV